MEQEEGIFYFNLKFRLSIDFLLENDYELVYNASYTQQTTTTFLNSLV